MPSFQQERLVNKLFRSKLRSILTKNKGVSLIELLLVIMAVGFLVLVIGNLPSSINLIGRARHQGTAREVAAKVVEDTRAIQYANLANGEVVLNDSRISLLPSGSGKRLIEDCDLAICTQGELVKQVTVTITWNEIGKTQTVKIKTLVAQGGLNQ